ncbi:hypothetical protein ACSLO2_27290, partial [Escherichia coli]|uniref:hypothetical protein n=1 Tax=Escherichia coli TaxID=562 RepID=UPI003EE3A2AE
SFFESVDESRLWLSKELECTCSANLYAAFTATPSFGLHFDNHHVSIYIADGDLYVVFYRLFGYMCIL